MARTGVDFNQVAAAASGLAADGLRFTVDSVRIRLGGTGSRSTIGPLVKRWKAENEQVEARAQTRLPAELLQSVQRLYEDIKHFFDEKLATEKEAATRGLMNSRRSS